MKLCDICKIKKMSGSLDILRLKLKNKSIYTCDGCRAEIDKGISMLNLGFEACTLEQRKAIHVLLKIIIKLSEESLGEDHAI